MFIGSYFVVSTKSFFVIRNALSYLGIRSIASLELATFMEMKKRLIKTKTTYVQFRKPVEKFCNNIHTKKY
jgi:hypothetical protein